MSVHLVSFITLGCAKNEVDSYDMKTRLDKAGFVCVDNPEIAEIVVINTCAFIQSAVEESIETILESFELPLVKSGQAQIVVSGCLPSRYDKELDVELPEVRSFIPCSKEDDIVEILSKIVENQNKEEDRSHGGFIKDKQCTELFEDTLHGQLDENDCVTPLLKDYPYTAYIKISDGCDKACSYCTIPSIRGHYHSYSLDHIESDIETALSFGAKEVVLIGQDTGIWGSDLSPQTNLATLLSTLAQKYPHVWIRIMYVQPNGLSDELLNTINTYKNVCSYIDMPLQHCEQHILKSMNRSGNKEHLLQKIQHIKQLIPDVSLRTTLMVGFPGETEEDFESLKDFVEEAEFDYVGVFAFSPEEGTPAAQLDQIEDDIKQTRANELRELADSVSNARIAERINKEISVLIEGITDDGQLYGRSMWQGPEVDGETFVDKGTIGSIVPVKLIDSLFYETEGEVLDV